MYMNIEKYASGHWKVNFVFSGSFDGDTTTINDLDVVNTGPELFEVCGYAPEHLSIYDASHYVGNSVKNIVSFEPIGVRVHQIKDESNV